ncbi:hypothetical protein F511_45124 [Dorcoceras hygrometricum]|uniref:Uncharacterized protein n=1 Tax=Dorcoceras hygrometricum TaxID=472368 RepID=A0A2Z7A437_9LAMI|nr:hypothetical protein F511_45124 [Dorcoceras hygrometricum]
MRREVKEMKRRRAEESVDGLSPAVARYQQTQATAHSVESFNEPAVAMNPVASFACPVDMESSRKLKYPVARYPVAVFEASAVEQSIQTTKKQLLREVL